MKKLPIELFSAGSETIADTASRSPIVWNGLSFSVCEELPFSIFSTVMRKAKELNLTVQHKNFKVAILNHTTAATLSDLQAWYRDNNKTITELAQIAYQTKDASAAVRNDLVNLHSGSEKLRLKLEETSSVLAKIKAGTLIQGGGNYEVSFNKANYSYTIQRVVRPAAKFIGDSAITLTKVDKAIKIDFDPTMTFKVIAGLGTYLVAKEYYTTLNLAAIVQGTRGITVKEERDHFSVAASESILASRNANIRVIYDPNLGYRVSLDPAFKQALNFKLYAGYGVEINYNVALGKHVVSAGNIAPQLTAGRNVELKRILANGQPTGNYEVKFSLPPMQESPDLVGVWPIVSTSQRITVGGKSQLINNLTVATDYGDSVKGSLFAVNQSLVNSDTLLSNMSMAMLTPEAKVRLKCPILNMFRIASSGTLAPTALARLPPEIQFLVTAFGATVKTVEIPVDLLPLMTTDTYGNGASLDNKFSFNAYSLLEAFIRKRAAAPSFTINNIDKGVRYSIISANLDTATTTNAQTYSTMPLDYNMGWVVSGLIDNTGRKIVYSAADYDFYCGRARSGQLNATPVVLTSKEAEDLNAGKLDYQIVSNVKSKTSTAVTHTITIKNTHTSAVSVVVWRKPLVIKKSNSDNMTEVSASNLPPLARFIGRLMSEWNYTLDDIIKMMPVLLSEKVKIDNSLAVDYYVRMSDPNYISLSGIFEAEGQLQSLTLDKNSGSIEVIPQMQGVSVGNVVSVNDIFSGLRVMLTFQINALTAEDYDIIEGDCNWDFTNYRSDTPCHTLSGTRTKPYLLDKQTMFEELTGVPYKDAYPLTSGGITAG